MTRVILFVKKLTWMTGMFTRNILEICRNKEIFNANRLIGLKDVVMDKHWQNIQNVFVFKLEIIKTSEILLFLFYQCQPFVFKNFYMISEQGKSKISILF